MNTNVQVAAPESIEAGVLVVIGFEKNGDASPLSGSAAALDGGPAAGWCAELYSTGEISGKAYEYAVLHRPPGMKAKRIALVGGGKAGSFKAPELRRLVSFAIRHFRGQAESMAFVVDSAIATPEAASAAIEGAVLGAWEQDHHKSTGKRENKIAEFTLVVPGGDAAALTAAAAHGRALAESQNFARDLVNEPGNLLPPRKLVEAAQGMAKDFGLECDVLDQDRMTQLGMGSLLGVSIGSAEPPFLIVLRYKPANPKSADHLGLVGKGVTFDTGGVSIKPADGMEKMKCDMGGAAAMLGAMRAIAQFKPSIAVTAFIPTVENMVGSRAQRPGDIVTSMAGKTIEVLNTDAEGRLILIDAITYAKQQGATHLIDAATLTGAIGVALGAVNTGIFSNNDPLCEKVLKASASEGEKMWRMPIDDEYREQLKSSYADIGNIGGRAGGACTAAMFLKEWVEDTPWAHLDIALTAYLDDQKPFTAKGATGVGVRTFTRVAMDW
ncbi:MAG TPA: leucyl aminopeptidase [Bryobacteraceae bacterium]|jgi:leucyl aminopeptidase